MGQPDIRGRSFVFSLRIIKLCQALKNDSIGRIILSQLLRSGTSIGANIEEAQAGQSKKDFLAKLSISRKEARETLYWLRLIKESAILPAKRLNDIINECEQITKILSSIILTSRDGPKSPTPST